MSAQIREPKSPSGGEYLSISESPPLVLGLMADLLCEESTLKKGVDHDPTTVLASVNTILGAMATNGSMETPGQIYTVFSSVICEELQRRASERGLSAEFRSQLEELCRELLEMRPFAHRTTVQGMLNGCKKDASDELLNRSFQQSMEELGVAGYTPPKVAINQDPHFAEFNPSFKNGEIRQKLVGGHSTLKTGYQYNLTNITPLGLYNAIDLAPKRQENKEDLGDLRYAVTFGKAAERVSQAGLTLAQFQGDRGLDAAGLFSVSRLHAWPSAAGEVGALAGSTEGAFLVTPWMSTHATKAELIAGEQFAEVVVQPSNFSRDQYAGNDPIVRAVLGPSPPCKVTVETAIVVLQKVGESYCDFSPPEVQAELAALQRAVDVNADNVEVLKKSYFGQLRAIKPTYQDRGLAMKLNAKRRGPLAGETGKAWNTRKQYNRAKRAGKALQRKLEVYLRQFQIFEVGADAAALALLKGPPCRARTHLVFALKTACKGYCSRWCIESGYEIIEYQFPLRYRGASSDTHVRIYVPQAMVFNSYRVAQIKHVGATKPHNWRPWKARMKLRCRQLSAAEQRLYSTKTHILQLLGESLKIYFCRSSSQC